MNERISLRDCVAAVPSGLVRTLVELAQEEEQSMDVLIANLSDALASDDVARIRDAASAVVARRRFDALPTIVAKPAS